MYGRRFIAQISMQHIIHVYDEMREQIFIFVDVVVVSLLEGFGVIVPIIPHIII